MSTKDIVKAFYSLNLAKDEDKALELFHKDSQIHWNSSKGLSVLDYKTFAETLKGIKSSFFSFTYNITHLFAEDNQGVARYTIYGTTIEEPEIGIALGHFISIVEVEDGKIMKVYQISQEADESLLNMSAF